MVPWPLRKNFKKKCLCVTEQNLSKSTNNISEDYLAETNSFRETVGSPSARSYIGTINITYNNNNNI